MTKIQECLANNMKLYRKKANLTQSQLAELVETSTNYIGTIEIGKKFPSLKMLEKIADALKIDSLQLFQANLNQTTSNSIDPNLLKSTLMSNIEKSIDSTLSTL